MKLILFLHIICRLYIKCIHVHEYVFVYIVRFVAMIFFYDFGKYIQCSFYSTLVFFVLKMLIEYFFLLKIINNKNECLFLCNFLLVIRIEDVFILVVFFNRLLRCTCSVICWLCYLSEFLLGFTAINIKLKFNFYFKNIKFCL